MDECVCSARCALTLAGSDLPEARYRTGGDVSAVAFVLAVQAKIAMQILNDARQELRSRLEVEEMEAHRAQAAEDISNMMRQPVF